MSGGKKAGQAQKLAAAAAERMAAGRERAEQLSLLAPADRADASPPPPAEGERRGPGRPAGSRNRVKRAELRKMFAARGWAMPEDQLARLAGLDLGDGDLWERAMARAEQIIAWSGGEATPAARIAIVFQVAGEIRRANEALLPYGLAKVTPDQGGGAPVTFINLPAPVAQGAPGDGARVIEGEARTVAASVYAPPPMPSQPQRNQEVSGDEDEGSDE
ncbi:hypothetical protein SAMN05444336_101271 [Albimonas donghaensis]|uniref:Uncharacterized protein n=1 Tax=Albimonas donghaensis TaxID=356660 RepID=A0A1H2R8H9_9RHOB|nr:hypothetical protein [Albimonas donghaensis]SDW15762.1 hypothetical protein SAMN05444336_101271 [Albimonas donghaensis]